MKTRVTLATSAACCLRRMWQVLRGGSGLRDRQTRALGKAKNRICRWLERRMDRQSWTGVGHKGTTGAGLRVARLFEVPLNQD